MTLRVPLTKYEDIVAGDGMSFLMHIYPKLDHDLLKQTLTRFLQENPTLRSRCINGEMIVPEDPTPDLEWVSRDLLDSVQFDNPASLTQKLHALSSVPEYKFRDGRQIRFLAHDLTDSTLLDLHFSHQCADGLCVITNAERFMHLLDPKVPIEPKPLRSITSEWMNAGNYQKYRDTVGPFDFSNFGEFHAIDLPRKNSTDYKKTCFHHTLATLPPHRVQQLLKRSRNHDATIMGVTWAASAVGYMALAEKYGLSVKFPTNFMFRTPVNLRFIYPEFKITAKDLTFGSFPILVPMKVDQNTNIWDVATYTKKQLVNEVNEHHQEKQFFCYHSMAPENAAEPPNTVNATSIGGFKFLEKYPSGHSVVDAKLMVTYALTPENALLHVDCFSTNHLGMKFNIAYMYPVIRDDEGEVYKNAVQHALDLMTDFDNVSLGQLAKHLQLKNTK